MDYRGIRLSAQGLAPGLEGSDQDKEASPASRYTLEMTYLDMALFAKDLDWFFSSYVLRFCRGLLYGVKAGPQESPQRRRLLELLAHSAKTLCLHRHVVLAPDNRRVPLFSSVDTQGLLGADGRFYILDMFRTFPADANFCPQAETESQIVPAEEEVPKICDEDREVTKCIKEGWPENYQTNVGLPRHFVHRLCRLKPELMDAFISHKWVNSCDSCHS